jgi:EAL domain-containing protein (putative c-di-GMP-specific phosphodiesterase class I)
MGIKTVAEFVENDAVRATLQQIGVDYVQGYGVGQPYPICDVPREEKGKVVGFRRLG